MDYEQNATELIEASRELMQSKGSAADLLRPLLSVNDINELKASLSVAIREIEKSQLDMTTISVLIAQINAVTYRVAASLSEAIGQTQPQTISSAARRAESKRDKRASQNIKLRQAFTRASTSGDYSEFDRVVGEYYDEHGLGKSDTNRSGQGGKERTRPGPPNPDGVGSRPETVVRP